MAELVVPIDVVIYHEKNEDSAVIGVGNPDIGGAKLDRIRLYSSSEPRLKYNTFLEGDEFLLRDGTSLSDWKSGVKHSIKFSHLDLVLYDDQEYIIPVYNIGDYQYYWDKRTLYSDYSVSGIFESDTLDLLDENKLGTFSLATYHRTDEGKTLSNLVYSETDEESLGRGEFSVTNNTILRSLSGDKKIGTDDILNTGEVFNNYGRGGQLFLKNFPVKKNSLRLVYNLPDNSLVELQEVDDINLCPDETGMYFSLDCDYGIISLSGATDSPLFLRENLVLDSFNSVIVVFPDDNFSFYPDRGVLNIDGELIKYNGKGYYSFYDCERGYSGSTKSWHSKHSVVTPARRGTTPSKTLFASYEVVPRFEYEITSYGLRSASNFEPLSVSTRHNVSTSKIVQITPSIPVLDSLTLVADKPLIALDYYGPAYFGTDVTKLTVTAMDKSGNVIENLDVTFEILQGNGSFENISDSIDKETNTEGEAYVFYNSSLSVGNTYLTVTNTSQVGLNTEMTVPGIYAQADLNEVFVYQILKFDPTYGTSGVRTELFDYRAAGDPHGLAYFDIILTDAEKYKDGILKAVVGGTSYVFTITHVIDYFDGTVLYKRMFVNQFRPISLSAGDYCYLISPEDIVWDNTLLNGVPVIVYRWNDEVQHPLTGELGAYFPVQPSEILGNKLTFENVLLPLPNPIDDSVNLGGYKIIAPQLVSFQANARDPFSGKIVKSNKVSLLVKLPNYLTGVSNSNALPIPHGFRIVSEEFNNGSGLGPANFITINPQTSGFNQLNIYGDV